MDVAFILDKYFKGMDNVSIDVFDAQTLNAVYRDVVNAMTSHFEIEVSVLQALSYCLYEMMDNVHIHSGKPLGTAMTHYDDSHKTKGLLSIWKSAQVRRLTPIKLLTTALMLPKNIMSHL